THRRGERFGRQGRGPPGVERGRGPPGGEKRKPDRRRAQAEGPGSPWGNEWRDEPRLLRLRGGRAGVHVTAGAQVPLVPAGLPVLQALEVGQDGEATGPVQGLVLEEGGQRGPRRALELLEP